jgi:NAD(P)-dependent dehydrogenase (short-subunit alcohol dehydrogenase family)
MESLTNKSRTVLVTGTSSGIGRGLCQALIKRGYKVFGTVRNRKDATELKKEFGENLDALLVDVTDEKQVIKAKERVQNYLNGKPLTALINNAGIATLGPVEFLPTSDFKKQIDTKILGTFLCTKIFLPLLGTDSNLIGNPGRIVNISSILGGKIGSPFMSGYCASKHAVEAFSESLRRELKPYRIKVIIVAPGSVSTPIWKEVKKQKDQNKYHKTKYGISFKKILNSLESFDQNSLSMKQLTSIIIKSIEIKNPKIRYNPTKDPIQKLWPYIPKKIMDSFF